VALLPGAMSNYDALDAKDTHEVSIAVHAQTGGYYEVAKCPKAEAFGPGVDCEELCGLMDLIDGETSDGVSKEEWDKGTDSILFNIAYNWFFKAMDFAWC